MAYGDATPESVQGKKPALPTGVGEIVGKTLAGVTGGSVAAPLIGIGAQALMGRFSKEGRALRQQQAKDISALQQGKLGLSEAQKRTMLAGTQRALQAQTAGVEANLRRQAAAAGGFGRSGAQTRALSQMAGQSAEAAAGAAGKIDQLSESIAQQRFSDVMKRLQESRAEKMQMAGQAAVQGAQLPADVMNKYKQAKTGVLNEAVGEVYPATQSTDAVSRQRYAGDFVY